MAELHSWQNRVYEDVVSTPVLKQLQHHSMALEEIEKRLAALPDEPASDDEIAELRDALDRLKDEFSQQLAEQALEQEEFENRVQALETDIQLLKETLETTTKRKWGLMFFTRCQKWRDKFSLRQIGSGARALSKALPQGISEELDIVQEAADRTADVIEELDKQS